VEADRGGDGGVDGRIVWLGEAVSTLGLVVVAARCDGRGVGAGHRRLGAAARATALAPDAEPPAEEAPDPLLERLLAAADNAGASVAQLDAAAHALLVRERFEEAEPLVIRALAMSPKDAEAIIHRVVLQGVLEGVPKARADLERLSRGPAGWEASLFVAGFSLQEGDEAAALRAFRRFKATAPSAEVTPELLAEMARLEARLGSTAPATK